VKRCIYSVIVSAPLLLASQQTVAAQLSLNSIQDWGGSFQASYTVTIEDEDTLNGILSSWNIEIQQPDPAAINSGWVSGYNGGVSASTANGIYTITNSDQGYQAELSAGSQLNILVQGSKPANTVLDASSFSIEFSPLDEPPVAVAEVESVAVATSVNDSYSPQSGDGFNAPVNACVVTFNANRAYRFRWDRRRYLHCPNAKRWKSYRLPLH